MSCTRSITCACIPMMMPSVTASHNWDEPSYLQNMSPPLEGSIESIFDQWADSDSFIVAHNGEKDWKKRPESPSTPTPPPSELPQLTCAHRFLDRRRYQRYIGVIYRRLTEVPSHYSKCSVAKQFDCVVHIRDSRGIKPLEQEDTWKGPRRRQN